MSELNENKELLNETGGALNENENASIENVEPAVENASPEETEITAEENIASSENSAEDASETEDEISAKELKKQKRAANKENFKQSFKTRTTKAGTYSFALCVIAVVIVILINMIVGKLPESITKLDQTSGDLYSLSDYSKQCAKNVNEKVTIYILAAAGSEDKTVKTILGRYQALNSNIKVVTKDPELSQFASKYTDEELPASSLIFVTEKRYKVVSSRSLYEYSQQAQQNAMYGYDNGPDIFDGENEITSALNFVTTDVLPVVYTLSGHGEEELGSTISTLIAKENIEVKDLNLMKEKKVPDDCKCLIFLGAKNDITEDEEKMIFDYLKNGGRMFITTDYGRELPNVDKLTAVYGMQREKGMVVEADMQHFYYMPNYLMADLQSHDITTPIIDSKYQVLLPSCQAVEPTKSHRETITLTSLADTSKKAFLREDVEKNSSAEKQKDDKDGPFSLAYAATEQSGDNETRVVYVGTSDFIGDNFASNAGNANLFLNSLKWMCELEESISVVESKSLANGQLEVSDGAGLIWNGLFVVVIPIILITCGILIWIRRKKR
ncbi:MAG: GldG family protein [Clostridiales bacterium]|nr:GldG family protein [Clostridiales bacterium]